VLKANGLTVLSRSFLVKLGLSLLSFTEAVETNKVFASVGTYLFAVHDTLYGVFRLQAFEKLVNSGFRWRLFKK